MAAPQFLSGIGALVEINGTSVGLPTIKWDVQPTAELVEFKNSQSGGYVVRQATFKDASVSFELDFDFANNPFVAPLALAAGQTIANVQLFLNGISGPHWTFTALIVEGTPQSAEVAGKIATTINCKNSGGAYTTPGN